MDTTIFHDHALIDMRTYGRSMETIGLLGEPTVFDSEGLSTHHVESIKKYDLSYDGKECLINNISDQNKVINATEIRAHHPDIVKFQNSTHIISVTDKSIPPYNYKFETSAIRWESRIIYSISERGNISLILRGNINSTYSGELEHVKLVDMNNREYNMDAPVKTGKTTVTLLTVPNVPYKLFHMISLRSGVIKARRRILFQTPIDIPPSTHNFMIRNKNVDAVEVSATGNVIPKSYHRGDTLDYLLDYTGETIAHVLLSRGKLNCLKISVNVVKKTNFPIMFYHKCNGNKTPKLIDFSGGDHVIFWDRRKTTICFAAINVDSFVINLEIMS